MPRKPKLTVELIPSTCHFSNVRTTVKKQDWDKIRFISYKAADNKCEICKDTGKNQGYKHNVECHEIWEYDDKNLIQKLVGLISLCPTCHLCVHYGRARTTNKKILCENHIRNINKWGSNMFRKHLEMAYAKYKARSKYQWSLDISILEKDPYNIVLVKNKKRMFKKPKKLKRRRKTKH